MKLFKLIISFVFISVSIHCYAQVENAGVVRKKTGEENHTKNTNQNTYPRINSGYENSTTHEADLDYMKQVYRRLDLQKTPNAALYFPEDVIDHQENLFRIILNNVLNGNIPAYEYLDGKEIFSDQYLVYVPDLLDRFNIYATEAKGSTERKPVYNIDEADVPSSQVLNYYIIEKWEFDRRSSSMKTKVEAICPVLNRFDDYGNESRFPMFWIKYDNLRPYLLHQFVYIDDNDNIPRYSLDDFFSLNLYDGEIYKIKNLRNLSLAQMFPDEDDLKRAQDSIDNYLHNYGKYLAVPSREEYLKMKETENIAKKDKERTEVSVSDIPVREDLETAKKENISSGQKALSSRSQKNTVKKNSSKKSKINQSSNTSAEKSVRRRKK